MRCLSCSSFCVNCTSGVQCNECYYGYTLRETGGCEIDDKSEVLYKPNTIDTTTKDFSQSSYIVSGLSSLPIILRGNPLVLLQLFDITQ